MKLQWLNLYVTFAAAALGQGVEHINLPGAVRLPAFSHATSDGNLIFVSGTLGTRGNDPAQPNLPDGVAAQTTQTLENIERILAAAGASRLDVLKCNVYLKDMTEFATMNETYIAFFGDPPPARTTVGVAALALGAAVEIECVAKRPEAQKVASKDIYKQSGFVDSEGERIYYESHGEGEALVFSHGLGGNHAIWYQQVPIFAQRYRVVTWDQRGFGRSTNLSGMASPETAARDLEAILNQLEIDKAHFIGQSMGGWCTVGFAAEHPERVRSIVLADTIGGIYTKEIEGLFDSYIQNAAQGPPPDKLPLGRHPALGIRLASDNLPQAFLYSQIGSVAGPAPANMGLLLRQTAWDMKKVTQIETPWLFVVGENDPIFVPKSIHAAAAQTKNATVVEIPATGHSPYFESPLAWNRAVLEFLENVQ